MAQSAIHNAERNDFSEVRKLFVKKKCYGEEKSVLCFFCRISPITLYYSTPKETEIAVFQPNEWLLI